jgi:hypothetical protein
VLHLIGHGAAKFVTDFGLAGLILLALAVAWYPWRIRAPRA